MLTIEKAKLCTEKMYCSKSLPSGSNNLNILVYVPFGDYVNINKYTKMFISLGIVFHEHKRKEKEMDHRSSKTLVFSRKW